MKCTELSNVVKSVIEKILIDDEGISYTIERDPKGFWQIGVGHYIGTDPTKLRLSHAVIMQILAEDIKTHWEDACEIFGAEWLQNQVEARQAAILSLVFNMGKTKLMLFHETVPAIKAENWNLVDELLAKTKWAKDVDPKQRPGEGRDDRIRYMFKEGKIHDYYKLS